MKTRDFFLALRRVKVQRCLSSSRVRPCAPQLAPKARCGASYISTGQPQKGVPVKPQRAEAARADVGPITGMVFF